VSTLITIVHIIVCFILILAVLLQSGKSADLAGAFGGGGSQTVFGPRGAINILSKLTTVSAVLFMITSLGLWILSSKGDKSVVRGAEAPAQETTTAAADTIKKNQAQQPTEKKQPEQKTEKKTPPEKK
jgi:preprotein translocase subunit SecG